jgi:hypothetical protein
MTGTRITCIASQGATEVFPWSSLATADLVEQARVETLAWIKRLRLVPYGAVSMRERFTYRDDSLWWFTELYLQKMRQLDQAVLTLLALDAARAHHAPARRNVDTADAAPAAAARAVCAARGVPVEVRGGAQAPPLSR